MYTSPTLLVERSKAGDSRAQGELYRRYTKAMLHVAARITRDPMEAEDVLQEAFIRAFRSLHRFKGESTFGAWLKRIVINTSINHLKQRKAETIGWEDLPDQAAEHDNAPEPEATPRMQGVMQAVNELPDGYRRVFTLYQLEGYDHKEISHILQISEATSKSQFSRAKKKLRQLLMAQSDQAIRAHASSERLPR